MPASGCVYLGSVLSPLGPTFVSAECSANTGLPISLAKGMAPSNFREGRKALTVFLLHGLVGVGVSFRLHGGPVKVSFLLISSCLSPAVGNQLRIVMPVASLWWPPL